MKIPKSIQLAGLKITIEVDETLIEKKQQAGLSMYDQQKILIDPSRTPATTMEQVYLHEVVHWILFVMNEDDLRTNEKFVDVFAHFLHQAIISSDHTGQRGKVE